MPSFQNKPLLAVALSGSLLFWAGLVVLLLHLLTQWLPSLEPPPLAPDTAAWGLAAGVVLLLGANYVYKAFCASALSGYAVAITDKQFADLFKRINTVSKRLGVKPPDRAYLTTHEKAMPRQSLHFGRKRLLVLNGEWIGALTERQSAIDFLIGREMARLSGPYRRWQIFLWPATVLPLLGPALGRGMEYLYDRIGIGACKTKVDAAFALAVMATGHPRWKSLNIPEFAGQSADVRYFWISVHEILSATPWLCKRMARLRAIATTSDSFIPRRHPLAYAAALFIPYLNLRAAAGLRHGLLLLLWAAIAAYTGQQVAEHWPLWRTATLSPGAEQTRSLQAPPAAGPSRAGPYARLRQDLERLGSLARALQKKSGKNPCAIGRLPAGRLHYPVKRYVFSCDEPVVYTRVQRGEFEAGQPAHVRGYNWLKKKHFTGSEKK